MQRVEFHLPSRQLRLQQRQRLWTAIHLSSGRVFMLLHKIRADLHGFTVLLPVHLHVKLKIKSAARGGLLDG